MNEAERISELAMLFTRASSALSTLEALGEVLEEYQDKSLSAEEALEEISDLLSEHLALGQMMNMSAEDLQKMIEEMDDEDEPPKLKP